MPTTQYYYYPALSELITLDNMPEILSFAQEAIEGIFDNLYYQNLTISKNFTGDSGYYNLSLLSKQKIQLSLFGSGLSLVLNPDLSDTSISSIPITIFWEWNILKYLNGFSASSFSLLPEDIFNLALNIFDITEENALLIAAFNFVVVSTPGVSVFEQLVSDINTLYNSAIIVDESVGDPYQQLISQINSINQQVYPTVFTLYLSSGDPTTQLCVVLSGRLFECL